MEPAVASYKSLPMRACHERNPRHATLEDNPEQISAAERCGLSVVIPVLDEEQGLLATLDGLGAVLTRSGRTFEIVVVDDGSTDSTPRLLAARPDVIVVHHDENRGYGAALKAGIEVARHPLVVVMDADGTYPAAAIPALVERCSRADMVVGARIGQHVHSTPARSAAKWCFRQFAQWITNARIPDLNSGLRVFHRAVAERFMPLLPDGFSFTTTITVASLLEGLVVGFESVDYLPRIGRSKLHPLRDTYRIARQLLWLALRFAPWRASVSIALPLLAVGLGSSLYHLRQQGHLNTGDFACLAAGVIALAVGLAAERRVRRQRSAATRDFVASRGSFTA